MSLIFDSPPLVVNPDLAVEIGLNEAIILQQIHYWVSKKNVGIERDGCRWIYNTHEQWQKQFPFLSQATIKRCLNKLRKLGLVSVQQFNKNKHDWTNFYSVNYEQIHQLKSSRPNGSICTHPSAQIDPIFTETTTEITAEITAENKPKSPAKLAGCPVDEILRLWKKVLPEKRQPVPSILKQGQTGKLLNDRWNQCMKIDHSTENRKLYHDEQSGLEFWEGLFNMIRQSEFLMSPESKWFTFAWLVKKANFEKLLSGDYHEHF